MVFSSLLFLFLFLSFQLLVYYIVGERGRNQVLLIFSLIFYAWAGPPFLLLLTGEAFVSWFMALRIERTEAPGARRMYLVLECVVLLGLLGIFKYLGFILENVQLLTGVPKEIPQIMFPLGISFYTFQLLSYVADVYRRQISAQPAYWKVLLYAGLFHQCVAGPIVRYEPLAKEIDHRSVDTQDLFYGIRRFSIGLAKKAILANTCGANADALLPEGVEALRSQSVAGLWLGVLFFSLQLYLDFSAYSDMAIGLGRMVGFHYLENFNYPFIARSVKDYWRRWHMSLSFFFRDYVYIPLGGSRCSTLKWVRNMVIVWFLTGLWHGANWNFILWGLFFLIFLLLERVLPIERLPALLGHIWTLLIVFFSMVLFRQEDTAELITVLTGMFGGGDGGLIGMQATTVFMNNIFFLIAAILAVTPIAKVVGNWLYEKSEANGAVLVLSTAVQILIPAVLLMISVMALVGASYNPFLYYNF